MGYIYMNFFAQIYPNYHPPATFSIISNKDKRITNACININTKSQRYPNVLVIDPKKDCNDNEYFVAGASFIQKFCAGISPRKSITVKAQMNFEQQGTEMKQTDSLFPGVD